MFIVKIWVWSALIGLVSHYLIAKMVKSEPDVSLRHHLSMVERPDFAAITIFFAPVIGPVLLLMMALMAVYRLVFLCMRTR